MWVRVVTAVVGLFLLVSLVGFGRPWHFSWFIVILTLGGLWEYFSLAFPDRWKERVTGILLGLAASLAVMFSLPEAGGYLALLWVGIFSSYLFFGGDLEERYRHLGWTVLGVIYVGFLFPHYVVLYSAPHGREWILFVLLVVMVGDTAAYFAGRTFGRLKLWPEVSPGKTVAGALGSLAAGVSVGVLAGLVLPFHLSWWEAVLLSLVLNLLAQLGDLFESWVKRVFAVKDSGNILPGHGGLLDRMDSLIFPGVVMTYYLRWLH